MFRPNCYADNIIGNGKNGIKLEIKLVFFLTRLLNPTVCVHHFNCICVVCVCVYLDRRACLSKPKFLSLSSKSIRKEQSFFPSIWVCSALSLRERHSSVSSVGLPCCVCSLPMFFFFLFSSLYLCFFTSRFFQTTEKKKV